MAELIGGKVPPKWDVSDPEIIEVIVHNMQTKGGNDPRMKVREEDNKMRDRLGICRKCRLRECLCQEGQ